MQNIKTAEKDRQETQQNIEKTLKKMRVCV